MTVTTAECLPPESRWRRWARKLAAFEEAMEFSADAWRDLRMEKIEAELVRLRAEVAALAAASGHLRASSSSPRPAP